VAEPGVLVVRDDGVIPVNAGIPVVHGLVDAIEQLVNSLGIPTREQPEHEPTEEQ